MECSGRKTRLTIQPTSSHDCHVSRGARDGRGASPDRAQGLARGEALVDLSFWRKTSITGADALQWLNDLVSADLSGLERLVGSFDLENVPDSPYRFDQPPAVLDALVALRDHEAIERVAPRWLRPGTYAEPFAIRALGVARGDAELLDEASRRFQTIGLSWRAEETDRWRREKIVA
jgi:hypothetical protein